MRIPFVLVFSSLIVGHIRLASSYITYPCGIQYATRMAWSCLEERERYESEKKEENGDKHCREKSQVIYCLQEKLKSCSNVDDIVSEMDHSYDQCDGNMLKPWLKHYLKIRYMPLTDECNALVSRRMFGSCKKSEKKYEDSSFEKWSFNGGIADQERMVNDGLECLSPIFARSSIDECGGRSGFDVYASALMNYIHMPLFGMGLYHRFSMAAALADNLVHDY